MNTSTEPLSLEERELAERLVRLGGHREPAHALDATILAAARAAVHNTAPARSGPTLNPIRKPSARWPVGLSLAASLVLAAGIGWRLHSNGSSESGVANAPAAAKAAAAEDSASIQAVILEPPLNRAPPPPPPPPLEADMQTRRDVAKSAPPAEALAKYPKRESATDAFVMDEAAPRAAPEADAMAAPAASNAVQAIVAPSGAAAASSVNGAGEGASNEHARDARDARAESKAQSPSSAQLDKADVVSSRLRQSTAARPPAAPTLQGQARDANLKESESADHAAVADQPFDDQPPASADSPQVRQAWLQRIRNLLAKHDTTTAANSLKEFRRRYPDAELPDDLRKFAASSAAKP